MSGIIDSTQQASLHRLATVEKRGREGERGGGREEGRGGGEGAEEEAAVDEEGRCMIRVQNLRRLGLPGAPASYCCCT